MFDLPEIDQAAAAATAILAPRLPLRFTMAGHDLEVCFPARGILILPTGWPLIDGRVDGHAIALEVGPKLLPPAAVAAFPELPTVGAPEALKALLLDLLLADLADAVELASGIRPEWDATSRPAGLPHRLILLEAAPSGDPLAGLHLSDGALAWIARRAVGLPVHQNDTGALKLSLPVVLDRFAVFENELSGIAVGDVVVLERDPVESAGGLSAMLLVPGRTGFRVRVAGSRLELLSDLDATMTDPDLPAASMDGLRLPVDVTLATLELPLARLATLAVGEVVELGLDATPQVVLRVNGQPVAAGELVRIAGRTGVRIVEVTLARRTP
jgi:type III secretion protein Q